LAQAEINVDDRAAREALRHAAIARIATVSRNGTPLIMPLFFVVVDGRIYMNNADTSPTVRNIAANPHVLLLIEGLGGDVVRVRGTARYLSESPVTARVVRAMFLKYYLRPREIWSTLRNVTRMDVVLRYKRERTAGMIEVTPNEYAVTSA
jgi:nitroimidazol reductase NimA-like FMN-containing flavoprotein (pyridoxamine 5'-phosphate oxidase superfamily)